MDHRHLTPPPDPPQPTVAPPVGNLEEPEDWAWESVDEDEEHDYGDEQQPTRIPFRLGTRVLGDGE